MRDAVVLDVRFHKALVEIDHELAAKVRARGCPHCGGKLHSAQYPRKPRGWRPEVGGGETRLSYCCETCRRRTTPASVRFLGRRVYSAAVMVLGSVLPGRLSVAAARPLCVALKVPKRTLARWREWWRQGFVKTPLWIHGQARFRPTIGPQALPGGLLERFQGDDLEA
ncbi:MAG: hypothetical protein Q8R95_08065, partial [Azonexus sp.]|nr:hypothetical protein [Azonexus sp.]